MSNHMSQSTTGSANGHSTDTCTEQDVQRVDVEQSKQELLEVLGDRACRTILDATSDSALSAIEVSERCELPLSTTYRKLDLLTDTGLLEERPRVRSSGKHTSEYCRSVTDIVISFSPHGDMELQITERDHSKPSGRLEQ